MSNCCSPGSGFPNASSMEQMATNHPVVWKEICAIQQAILAASSQCQPGGGQMCTIIDELTPMTYVSGISSVTVTNGGSGYYTDTPAVQFIPPAGSIGQGATGNVVTNGNNIISIQVTNGGSSYQPVHSTLNITSITGSAATLTPLVDASTGIVGVVISNAGAGYTTNDVIIATRAKLPNPAYVDAILKVAAVGPSGNILSIAILNPGSGYDDSVTTMRIVSSLNNGLEYPLGAGLAGTVNVNSSGSVASVQIFNVGAGYATFMPYLVITDPGTGATTSLTLNGTAISTINVVKNGTNYTSTATGTVFNPPTAALPNPPATPAVVQISSPVNTYGTDPGLYWQVWQGATTNKAIQLQLNAVISYFQNLGYTISIQSNPSTGSTIQWYVCW